MQLKNSDEKYGAVAKLFHWAIALLIIGMLILGNVMEDMSGPNKLQAYGIHKSTGIIVLFLVFLRFGWRISNRQPGLPADMPKLMRFGAHVSHFMLYALMFAMPITGWLMSSAAGFPVSVFGLFTMPNPIGADREMREAMNDFHGIAANVLIALLLTHIAAGLFHHFIRKDNIMRRMLPLILILIAFPALAAPVDFSTDKTKSNITFTAIQNDAPVKGEFRDYNSEISFSPDSLDTSKVRFDFGIAGIYTDYEDVAASLKTAEWFDAAKFPRAVFESITFQKGEGENNYVAAGKLTIRDITREVMLPFTLVKFSPQEAEVTGKLTIKRNDFDVGQGDWKDTGSVKDEVVVEFNVIAVGK